jgi:nucleoredoxin
LKNLINGKGENVSTHPFVNKVIGLYFAGSAFAPCQTFTPILKNVHKKLQERNIEFEVIFVSVDKDVESFQKYFQQMPWLAIQFEDKKTRAELAQMFQIKTVPTLILFDQKGNFLSADGRKILSMDQKGEHYPWSDISALGMFYSLLFDI